MIYSWRGLLLSIAALSTMGSTGVAQEPPTTAPATKPKPSAAGPAATGAKAGETNAEAKSGPDMTTETYGDWIMRCQQVESNKLCEVSQTITVQGQQKPIAQVAIGREKKSDPIRLVVQLPTNITFEGGVKAATSDGNAALDMPFKRCFPIGCFADAAMDNAVIDKLKAQNEPGSLKFRDATQREISLPFSFKGFGAAVEALSRTQH